MGLLGGGRGWLILERIFRLIFMPGKNIMLCSVLRLLRGESCELGSSLHLQPAVAAWTLFLQRSDKSLTRICDSAGPRAPKTAAAPAAAVDLEELD